MEEERERETYKPSQMKEEVLRERRQEEMLKTQLTTRKPAFGICSQICKTPTFTCASAHSTTCPVMLLVFVLRSSCCRGLLAVIPSYL